MRRLHFLDALRGWAALVVVICHTMEVWLINPERMSAMGLTHILDAINSTPIGVAMDGQLAIYVFFTISGMALSYSILSAPRPHARLTELALVRYPRLTIPVLGSCVLAYLIFVGGGFHNAEAAAAANSDWLSNFYRFEPQVLEMLRFSLFDVYFAYDGTTSWNAVLWTMPIELICSFAIFALLVLPWRVLRIPLAFALSAYFYNHAAGGFFAGYLLAEFIVTFGTATRMLRLRQALGLALIAFAVALATLRNAPMEGATIDFLQTITGRNLIALLLLAGVTLSPYAQQSLSGPLSLFMGRISFGLYLVHLLVICSLSSAVFMALHGHAPFLVETSAILVLTLATSLLGAWVFTTAFEEPTLRRIKHWLVAVRTPAPRPA